jgi:hypothetical protein
MNGADSTETYAKKQTAQGVEKGHVPAISFNPSVMAAHCIKSKSKCPLYGHA